MADPPPYPGTPRWVRISAITAAILILLAVILMVISGGRHGPGRHLSTGHDQPARPAAAEGATTSRAGS